VLQRLDGTDTVLTTAVYDAWGNQIAGDAAIDPYGYKGEFGYYTDAETGLILCTHRYYDPQAGRWVNRDLSGYGAGLNLYKYCDNDPIDGMDYLGMFSVRIAYVGLTIAPYGGTWNVGTAVNGHVVLYRHGNGLDGEWAKLDGSIWKNDKKIGQMDINILKYSLIKVGFSPKLNIASCFKDKEDKNNNISLDEARAQAYKQLNDIQKDEISEWKAEEDNSKFLTAFHIVTGVFKESTSPAGDPQKQIERQQEIEKEAMDQANTYIAKKYSTAWQLYQQYTAFYIIQLDENAWMAKINAMAEGK
jgi:RHS repeat-associated protein